MLALAREKQLVPSLLRSAPDALVDAAAAAAAPPPAALLHALGFGLKLAAAELFAALRPPLPVSTASIADGAADGAAELFGPRLLIRADPRPVLHALLLTVEATAPDHTAGVVAEVALGADAASAAAEPPLCRLMRCVWQLAHGAGDKGAFGRCGGVGVNAPRLARWRGEKEVELVHVAGLDQELRQHSALSEAEVHARLHAAVRLNTEQELMGGVLHALSGCRQLVLLLKLACAADATSAPLALTPADPQLLAPRLSMLQALLQLLATPSAVAPRVGEPLCACVRSLLSSVGPALPIAAAAQLELTQLALAALAAPQRLPSECRRSLYLLLQLLLALPRSAATMAWQHPQQTELQQQVRSVVCCRPPHPSSAFCTLHTPLAPPAPTPTSHTLRSLWLFPSARRARRCWPP